MALSFDFSVAIQRLDRRIRDLHDLEGGKVFSNESPLIHEANQPVGKCLSDMANRGLRTCLIHFPEGIEQFPRKFLRRHTISQGSEYQLKKPRGIDPAVSDKLTIGETIVSLDNWAHEQYQFLDMRDVLCLLLEKYNEVYGPTGEKSEAPAREFLNELLEIPAGHVANLSDRNGFTAGSDGETLRSLLQKFETSPRIPVFEVGEGKEKPELKTIFSVIDFLQFLNNLSSEGGHPTGFLPYGATTWPRKTTLTPIDGWTAGMIKTATQPWRAKKYSELHICLEDESLFQAMKVLHKTGFSAIPIVSHSNPRNCKGVFSVRDLQPILLNTADIVISGALLSIPIMDYVSSIRQKQSLKARYPVIHLREHATIDAVIGKILAANVRRILLTDEEGLLTGILSITDLGRFIAREIAGRS